MPEPADSDPASVGFALLMTDAEAAITAAAEEIAGLARIVQQAPGNASATAPPPGAAAAARPPAVKDALPVSAPGGTRIAATAAATGAPTVRAADRPTAVAIAPLDRHRPAAAIGAAPQMREPAARVALAQSPERFGRGGPGPTQSAASLAGRSLAVASLRPAATERSADSMSLPAPAVVPPPPRPMAELPQPAAFAIAPGMGQAEGSPAPLPPRPSEAMAPALPLMPAAPAPSDAAPDSPAQSPAAPLAPAERPDRSLAPSGPVPAGGEAASVQRLSQDAAPTHGDVFLDGVRVGHWMSDALARAAGGPARGSTAYDPRMGPRWPGALQGQ